MEYPPNKSELSVLDALDIRERLTQNEARALFRHLGLEVESKRQGRATVPQVRVLPGCRIDPSVLVDDDGWVVNTAEALAIGERNRQAPGAATVATDYLRAERAAAAARERERDEEARATRERERAEERAEQERRSRAREEARQRMAELEARRAALPDHLLLDSSGVLWEIGDVNIRRLIQDKALEDDTSIEAARRTVLGNVEYWVPGARRVDGAEVSTPGTSYPQALGEGDTGARRSVGEER